MTRKLTDHDKQKTKQTHLRVPIDGGATDE